MNLMQNTNQISKIFNSTGFVFGKFWGEGKGSYEAEKLRGFSSEKDLLKEARRQLKSGSLDSGMGYQKLIGAILEIEEKSTTIINDREFTNSEFSYKFIGKLTKREKEFLMQNYG